MILVVFFFLLWRNSARKAKDLKMDIDCNGSIAGSHFPPGDPSRQSLMTSRMLGDAHSIPQDPPPDLLQQSDMASLHKSASMLGVATSPQQQLSALSALPPQTPIMGLSANNGSMASTLAVQPPVIPLHAFPQAQQPTLVMPPQQQAMFAPPAPPPHHPAGLPRNHSQHSLGAPSPLPSPAATRRAASAAPPAHRAEFSEEPKARPQQPLAPMGLPRSQGKLVPGRMSGQQSGPLQRQGSQGSVRREIPSTAV